LAPTDDSRGTKFPDDGRAALIVAVAAR
jgi:hypothetical protein